jgi:cell division septation protein DedD
MTNWFRIYIGMLTLLMSVCLFEFPVFAQTSVTVEVRVLELSRMELEAIGGSVSNPGFAKSLTKDMAASLSSSPRANTVHRVELQAKSGVSSQLRLDSRITGASSSSGDVQSYFDIGIGLDVTPRVFQSRDISLDTSSQVRIRRSPEANGTQTVVFENPPKQFEVRIHEGESIVIGGFITGAERMRLPDMPTLPDNPILNYLFPKKREPQDRPEIAILLTPRIMGTLINGVVDPPVPASSPVVVTPPVTQIAPPAATPSSNANALAISNPPAAVNRPPVASPAVLSNAPAVVTPPAPVNAPTVDKALAISTPATADAPVVEGTGGKFTVQVGAFDLLEKAEALRSQLSKKYDMVFVDKIPAGKTPYRVRVGRFPDMTAARRIERKLKSEGIETYVTALN